MKTNSPFNFLLHWFMFALSYSSVCSVDPSEIDIFGSDMHKIVKRERAFELAYIEATFEDQEKEKERVRNNELSKENDEEDADEMCKEKCNDNLRKGLDMVKAHLGFGSIGVPPVIDESDLLLYCRLDLQHDRCLRKCGFTVQFNMRDFVCKKNYKKMRSFLPCYRYAAPRLKRECGAARCGPYASSEASLVEYAHRCRALSCDLNCIQAALVKDCGEGHGIRAASFLANYVKEKVIYWMKDLPVEVQKLRSENVPRSCKRLICDTVTNPNCPFSLNY